MYSNNNFSFRTLSSVCCTNATLSTSFQYKMQLRAHKRETITSELHHPHRLSVGSKLALILSITVHSSLASPATCFSRTGFFNYPLMEKKVNAYDCKKKVIVNHCEPWQHFFTADMFFIPFSGCSADQSFSFIPLRHYWDNRLRINSVSVNVSTTVYTSTSNIHEQTWKG